MRTLFACRYVYRSAEDIFAKCRRDESNSKPCTIEKAFCRRDNNFFEDSLYMCLSAIDDTKMAISTDVGNAVQTVPFSKAGTIYWKSNCEYVSIPDGATYQGTNVAKLYEDSGEIPRPDSSPCFNSQYWSQSTTGLRPGDTYVERWTTLANDNWVGNYLERNIGTSTRTCPRWKRENQRDTCRKSRTPRKYGCLPEKACDFASPSMLPRLYHSLYDKGVKGWTRDKYGEPEPCKRSEGRKRHTRCVIIQEYDRMTNDAFSVWPKEGKWAFDLYWGNVLGKESSVPESQVLLPFHRTGFTGCGTPLCTKAVQNTDVSGYTCAQRINWLISNDKMTETDACTRVASQPGTMEQCGPCMLA